MLRRFNVILEWDLHDKVWVTYVPSLEHLSTFGDTKEEAIANTREAIIGYYEAAKKENYNIITDDHAVELIEMDIAV